MVKKMLNYMGNALIVGVIFWGGAVFEHFSHPIQNFLCYESMPKIQTLRETQVRDLEKELDNSLNGQNKNNIIGLELDSPPEVYQKNGNYLFDVKCQGERYKIGLYTTHKENKDEEKREEDSTMVFLKRVKEDD